jgi:hypothetical protein
MFRSQGRSQIRLRKVGIVGNQLYSLLGGFSIGSGIVYCSISYIYHIGQKSEAFAYMKRLLIKYVNLSRIIGIADL